MGFFQESELLVSREPMSRTPQCAKCGLYKTCKSPKMPVTGKGEKKILIVGEAPGEQEDKRNKQFVGPSGELLESSLRRYGVDMRRDCWLTNSIICRPPNNREPKKEIEYCRPNIVNAIEELKPEKVLLFGGPAVGSVIGWLWKEKAGGVGRWVGWQIPAQKINAWVMPFWHPSYLLHSEKDQLYQAIKTIWRRDLKDALAIDGRPWSIVPDYKKEVRIIIDHYEAAEAINQFTVKGQECAFDYETNCLKPDWDDAEIVSCSISDGVNTISFPWVGEVIKAMKHFVRSKCGKIASNMKFEERWTMEQWTMKELECKVRNWVWDTMVGAHVFDNRRDISSIKFQSFVMLGAESYNDHIKPFLRTKGNEKINSVIKSVELRQLLLYGGLDSLLEWLVALKQRKLLGYI
jgi:uracil-DNA glycosylase